MADFASVAASVFSCTVQVGTSLLRLLQAIGTFNYQLISSLFRLLSKGWQAVCVVSGAMYSALAEIGIYVFDFVQELGQFSLVALQFLLNLGVLLLHLLSGVYAVLEEIPVIIASALWSAWQWIGDWLADSFEYLGVSGENIAKIVKSFSNKCQNWISTAGLYVKECSLVLTNATCMLISDTSHLTLNCIKYYTVLWFESFHNLLSYFNTQLTYLWDAICTFLSNSIPKIQDFCLKITNSPDLYWTIAITLTVILVLRIFVITIRKKGFTIPFVNNSSIPSERFRQRLTLDLMDSTMIVSDEEDLASEEEGDSDESESDTASTASANTRTTSSHHPSLFNDSASDEDSASSVDEFEINDDSDFESGDENDQNLINIQLPHRNGAYGLRTRATPARSISKLSPDELEKHLEKERDRRLCVVCQDQVKNVLVLPCKHMCMCIDCAHAIVGATNPHRRVCPLCRAGIHTVMDVFV